MSDAVVHVFDPGKPGRTKDFTCSIHTLTHGMRYFKDVLQKSVDSRITPVEISVHCDVAVFEWLLGYCSGRVSREDITVDGVLPLLIASNFLQMDTLVGDCLAFMSSNLVAVAKHHQQLATQGGDLTALPLELLSRLARLVPERKLEELASLTPPEVRARHMPLVNRLYKYKLEACLRDLKTTVARCSICQGLFSLAERAKLECSGPPPPPPSLSSKPSSAQASRRSATAAAGVHIPDAAWRLQEYLSSLRGQQIPWRGIFWHVWGLVHVLYCHTCMQYVPASELRRCTFHPQAPVFAATAAPAVAAGGGGSTTTTTRQLAMGFYPCCGISATRGIDPRVATASGCCAREHRLIPSGQAPGAPLPPGLTTELLTTLQHCTPLFTNPSAVMARDSSGDLGVPRIGEAVGVRSTSASTAHGGGADRRATSGIPATAGDASTEATLALPDAATAAMKSPRFRHVSFLSNNASTPRTGSEDVIAADADGRLVPPAMQAVMSASSAAAAAAAAAAAVQPRRSSNSATHLGPATAAAAAALGYSLNGVHDLDLSTSGLGPTQLLRPPQQQHLPMKSASARPQSPLSQQTSFNLGTMISNSPLEITGNPQVDTRRVAAAVARRLSQSSGSGVGGAVGETSHANAQQSQDPRRPHRQHRKQPITQQQQEQQQQEQQQQEQQQQEQQQRRRPVLDTARSFTSLAALQQVAEEVAGMSAVLRPPASRYATQPSEDWDRIRGPDQQPLLTGPGAAGAASLRMLFKTTSSSQYALGSGGTSPAAAAGGGGGVLERSLHQQPRKRPPTHSPRQRDRINAHQAPPISMFSSSNLEPQAIQLPAPPPPSPSTTMNKIGGRVCTSPDMPRDNTAAAASPPPPRNGGGGGGGAGIAERRRPLQASGLLHTEKQQQLQQQQQQPIQLQQVMPQACLRHHQSQRLQQAQHSGAGYSHSSWDRDRGRGLQRGQSERSGVRSRRELALPPRPGGNAFGMQRRHSGGSWTYSEDMHGPGTDGGEIVGVGGGGEEDGDRPHVPALLPKSSNGVDWSRRRLLSGGTPDLSRAANPSTEFVSGSGSGSLSGVPSAGSGSVICGMSGGGGSGNVASGSNLLQRSVQAVLSQQRRRRMEIQEEKFTLPQPLQPLQPPNYSSNNNHLHSQQAQAHRQRSAGKGRQVLVIGSWGSREEASAATASTAVAEDQERRALIEQYKTQKVLSPRPKNVHMIAISELPSGPGSGGGGGGSMSGPQGGRISVTPLGSSLQGAETIATPRGARTPRDGFTGGALGQLDALTSRSVTAAPAMVPGETSPDSTCLFTLAGDEPEMTVLLPLPPSPAGAGSAVAAAPNANAAEGPTTSRGRRLRMELLYEDDNYRMDLLEKHLLACRPSNRIVTAAAIGGRDQRALRGRVALAPSLSRAAGAGVGASAGPGRGRPLSAAAALYGIRQARPRSRSVSHMQRLQNIYTSSAGTTGYAQGGVDAQSGRVDGALGDSVGGGSSSHIAVDLRCSMAEWEKMGSSGWNASVVAAGGSAFGAGARRSQDARPLSAPRTWRYT